MIIAPLSTPIMGIALGLALRPPQRLGRLLRPSEWNHSSSPLASVFSLVVPQDIRPAPATARSPAARPPWASPDLVAAIATGFAGAIALCRRDVAAVLPGVAIAISLSHPSPWSGSVSARAPPASPPAPSCSSSPTSSRWSPRAPHVRRARPARRAPRPPPPRPRHRRTRRRHRRPARRQHRRRLRGRPLHRRGPQHGLAVARLDPRRRCHERRLHVPQRRSDPHPPHR